jgi:hypothetical protein
MKWLTARTRHGRVIAASSPTDSCSGLNASGVSIIASSPHPTNRVSLNRDQVGHLVTLQRSGCCTPLLPLVEATKMG